MDEMTLSSLILTGKAGYFKDTANFMAISVSVYGARPETIINPVDNVMTKLDYLETAYNEDLTLKSNENIKIVDYVFVKTAEELINIFK